MSRYERTSEQHEQVEKPHRCAQEGICRHRFARSAWLAADPLVTALGDRTPRDIDRLLGQSRDTWGRWLRDGRVPLDQADRIACALALHPSSIWGESWWAAA